MTSVLVLYLYDLHILRKNKATNFDKLVALLS